MCWITPGIWVQLTSLACPCNSAKLGHLNSPADMLKGEVSIVDIGYVSIGTFFEFHGLCSISMDGWHRTKMNVDDLNPLLATAYIMFPFRKEGEDSWYPGSKQTTHITERQNLQESHPQGYRSNNHLLGRRLWPAKLPRRNSPSASKSYKQFQGWRYLVLGWTSQQCSSFEWCNCSFILF